MRTLCLTMLSFFFALQGQAGVCPLDLLDFSRCAQENTSCCGQGSGMGATPCCSGQNGHHGSDTENTPCDGNCRLEAHTHSEIWQIQNKLRTLLSVPGNHKIVQYSPQNICGSSATQGIIKVILPGPVPRLAFGNWRL